MPVVSINISPQPLKKTEIAEVLSSEFSLFTKRTKEIIAVNQKAINRTSQSIKKRLLI